mgnify:CR=1 FL=1
MTSRKEDELDLTAMSIAQKVKRSDNLRVPRNPEKTLREMRAIFQQARRVREDGAA